MDRREFTKIMGAVVAGMVAGSRRSRAERRRPTKKPTSTSVRATTRVRGRAAARPATTAARARTPARARAAAPRPRKHDCKGQNACKGQGGCKTGDNGCAGKNSCKGKGGCAVPVKHEEKKQLPSAGATGPLRRPARGSRKTMTHVQPVRPSRPRHRHRPAHRPLRRDPRARSPRVDWFEVLSENFLDTGGRPLARARPGGRALPGGAPRGLALDRQHRPARPRRTSRKLKALADAHPRPLGLRPPLLDRGRWGATPTTCCPCPTPRRRCATWCAGSSRCRTSWSGRSCSRTRRATSSSRASTMPEWEFLARARARTPDCGLLLDVNNVYVQLVQPRLRPAPCTSTRSRRTAWCSTTWPATRTRAPTSSTPTPTTRSPRCGRSTARAWARTGPAATLYEWDEDIPALVRGPRRGLEGPRPSRAPSAATGTHGA